LKKKKFILTLSNDKVPIIAEVDKNRVVGKDERVIGWDCVKRNIEEKTFTCIRKQTKYKEGRIYGHTESL
jgi:hypothetical protein